MISIDSSDRTTLNLLKCCSGSEISETLESSDCTRGSLVDCTVSGITYVSNDIGWFSVDSIDVTCSGNYYSEDLSDFELSVNCENCGAPLFASDEQIGYQLHKFDTCKCNYCGTIQTLLKKRSSN